MAENDGSNAASNSESELTTAPRHQVFVPATEGEILAARIGPVPPLNGPIELAEYDPAWPQLYAREAERIQTALGDQVVLLEHVGSTSVPGLAAKPRIDILLTVPHSAEESAYVPALEAVGYVLCIREPDWYEHRVFKGPDTDVNLHVFSQGCAEVARMLLFRDWLRTHPPDRQLYEHAKRELARRPWKYVQQYADAKTEVVESILARVQGQAGSNGGEARRSREGMSRHQDPQSEQKNGSDAHGQS